MRFSMFWRYCFVHCVPVRISPVAVSSAVEHRRRGGDDKEAVGRHLCFSWATAESKTRRLQDYSYITSANRCASSVSDTMCSVSLAHFSNTRSVGRSKDRGRKRL